MTAKRFTYWEEENGEFPFPYIKDSDGKDIISLYECCECMNALHDENEQLKQGMDKLFDYFAKWFEEERGTPIEEFIELWKSIQKGDVE